MKLKMSNQLRANATEFTPTFTVPSKSNKMAKASETEMSGAEIDNLEVTRNLSSAATPRQVSALPPHMKKHAAEFWFPESRYVICLRNQSTIFRARIFSLVCCFVSLSFWSLLKYE
jgi:hypothetical protein